MHVITSFLYYDKWFMKDITNLTLVAVTKPKTKFKIVG